MKLVVIAHPGSKNPRILKDLLGGFQVYVREPALGGEANEAVRLALAEYFKVAKSLVVLRKGHRNKIKEFSIDI